MLFSKWVNPKNEQVKKNEYHFVSGGAAGVNFWKVEGATLSKKAGRFNKKYKQCPIVCAANIQGKDGQWKVVMGTSSGDLYVFDEREVTNAVEKAHTGAVLCLAEGGDDGKFLVSGGRDKHIRVWNQALQPITALDLTKLRPSYCDPSVASLDVKPYPHGGGAVGSEVELPLVVLAGTYGGEILEVTAKVDVNADKSTKSADDVGLQMDLVGAGVEVMLNSHFSGELWGVATHPTDKDIVATCGDDSTLRIWSIKRNSQLACVDLGWPARSVAWHPTGFAVAVGFHELTKGGLGGGKGKKGAKAAPAKAAAAPADGEATGGEGGGAASISQGHSGSVHIYSVALVNSKQCELKKRAEGCSSVAWIGELKFNVTGNLLGAGSHDKRLYMYEVPPIDGGELTASGEWPEWKKMLSKEKYQFNKHSSALLHFDFSLDGLYWQSNCQASELLFGNTADGKQITSASKLADYNSQLDDTPESEGRLWATQTCTLGWPVQGIWPPGADMSDINSVDRHVGCKLLATADDFGLVKLFRYPCVSEGSKFAAYSGHSSHVTNVRWTVGDTLISVGGNDKCVFVWQLSEK